VRQLFLYSRDECELCDKALAMVQEELTTPNALANAAQWNVVKIDITKDAKLSEKFGWHIPVIERTDTNALLYWPFPPSRLRDFLANS